MIILAKPETDDGEFMSNVNGSHFCESCPVVVFGSDKVGQPTRLGIRGDANLRFAIGGIVDFNAISKAKRHLEIGIDDNPIPLVHFLPD